MSTFRDINDARIYCGDTLAVLPTLAAKSVRCCVTSPPYWGLRDYGTATWEGGDSSCDHRSPTMREGRNENRPLLAGSSASNANQLRTAHRLPCGKCGAVKIDRQIGLEQTPEEYVERLVAVFREVRRVLTDDGTLWMNLGDSYASDDKWGGSTGGKHAAGLHGKPVGRGKRKTGLKGKDLVGIPWMVAFALQQPYYSGSIKNIEDRVWLAAMLDAEGCMFIHKRKAGQNNGQGYKRVNDNYGPGVEICNTHYAVVERISQLVGKGSICTSEKGKHGRKQTLYRWNLRTTESKEFVREIYPHLVAKRQQARILLGCPSSGDVAEASHAALIGLHNGVETSLDFPEPETMFEKGYYLRQDIIWSKSNPMPESVTDRCTKAHEYLFLLSKSARYYFDAEAIAEEAAYAGEHRGGSTNRYEQNAAGMDNKVYDTRNKRSVWTITTKPFKEAHFAVMPRALVEPCIKAGSEPGDTILDPFGGSGTVAEVALRLNRKATLIELNPEYVGIQTDRLRRVAGAGPDQLFAGVA